MLLRSTVEKIVVLFFLFEKISLKSSLFFSSSNYDFSHYSNAGNFVPCNGIRFDKDENCRRLHRTAQGCEQGTMSKQGCMLSLTNGGNTYIEASTKMKHIPVAQQILVS